MFVLPTYFTAVNGISPTMVKIGADMNKLGARAAAAQAQMNGFLPSFGGIGKSMGHMLPSLAAGGVLAGIALSGKAVADYGVEISNLGAVTGATGEQLDIFKRKIKEVATDKSIQRSVVEVAQAFTTVDNNMPELHKLPQDLAEVTKQTIILAKAGRMELAPSAEAMTMSMHQFALTAKDARHVTDVMAAGAVYGSSRIAETSEALQKFGTAAKNTLNVTFEESVALVELASRFEKGSEAGTRLRNILLDIGTIKAKPDLAGDLRRFGVNVDIATDKTKPLLDRLTEIAKIKDNAVVMQKLFDKRNITMASGLFTRIDKYQAILDGLKEEGRAAQMAETNTDNLTGSINKLTAAWVTTIATSEKTNIGIKVLGGSIDFLTNNLNGITTTVVLMSEAFIGYKLVLFGTTKAVYAYEFAMGAMATVNATVNEGIMVTTASMAGFNAATRAAAISTQIFKAGLWSGLGVIGLAAGAIISFGEAISYSNEKEDYLNRKLVETKDGFKEVVEPVNQATIALREYEKAQKEFTQRQNDHQYDLWMKEHHPFKYAMSDMYSSVFQFAPFLPGVRKHYDPTVQAPNVKDFGDTTGASGSKTGAPEYIPGTGSTTTIDTAETVSVLKDIRTLLRQPGSSGGKMAFRTQTGTYA